MSRMTMHGVPLSPQPSLLIQAYKADGVCYRWWTATVESVTDQRLVTIAPPGSRVEGPRGNWTQPYWIRAFYWHNHPYNLLEVYRADGRLEEVYVHSASPAHWTEATLTYIDYELDVVCKPNHPPQLVDQEEYAQAVLHYGYSPADQARHHAAALQALDVAAHWHSMGIVLPTRAMPSDK